MKQKYTHQLCAVLEASQPTRIVQETLKPVVIDVVLQFCKQSPDEVADEDHFRFQCTQHGQ